MGTPPVQPWGAVEVVVRDWVPSDWQIPHAE